jgi:hypothetical protein
MRSAGPEITKQATLGIDLNQSKQSSGGLRPNYDSRLEIPLSFPICHLTSVICHFCLSTCSRLPRSLCGFAIDDK